MFFEISEVELVNLDKVEEISYNGDCAIQFKMKTNKYEYEFDTQDEAQQKYDDLIEALNNRSKLVQ